MSKYIRLLLLQSTFLKNLAHLTIQLTVLSFSVITSKSVRAPFCYIHLLRSKMFLVGADSCFHGSHQFLKIHYIRPFVIMRDPVVPISYGWCDKLSAAQLLVEVP